VAQIKQYHIEHLAVTLASLKGWTELGLMSHQTYYSSYWGRVFTGQMTQPTVSKH